MEEKKKHGGARPGSGRPPTDRNVRLTIKLSEEAVKILDELTTNRSKYLDELLKKQNR